MMDMAGRIVYTNLVEAGGFTNMALDINHLNSGLYFLKVKTGDQTGVVRFIKE